MARFMATMQGNRGEASRLGSKNSGIRATINGWNVGVTVNIWHNSDTGKDEISVIETTGSGYGDRENAQRITIIEQGLSLEGEAGALDLPTLEDLNH